VVGYANRPWKVDAFAAADVVVTSMGDIAEVLSPLSPVSPLSPEGTEPPKWWGQHRDSRQTIRPSDNPTRGAIRQTCRNTWEIAPATKLRREAL
jgi:hypothetical protein